MFGYCTMLQTSRRQPRGNKMKTIAKMIGQSLVCGVVGAIGATAAALVLSLFGIQDSFLPFLVGGVWSGEYLNSVIWK